MPDDTKGMGRDKKSPESVILQDMYPAPLESGPGNRSVTGCQERSRNQAPSKHPCPCPGSALTTQDPTFPALHLQPQEETQCSKQVGRTRGRIRPATIEATHKAPVRYPAVKGNSLANMQR